MAEPYYAEWDHEEPDWRPASDYEDSDTGWPYPDDDHDLTEEDETTAILADPDTMAAIREGQGYSVLSSGDAVCSECGATRSTERIADHIASEHDDDPVETDDPYDMRGWDE
jgi:hypothetical protein